MAQDFERSLNRNISNSSGSATTIRAQADSDDAIIGIRCANSSTSAVKVTVYVENSSTIYYLIKDAPISAGGSLELIDGASKVVLQNGDAVKAFADTASAVDIIVSAVDTISS
jgi:hypothetical protein|tara:strand:+ start:394 stop:732 length:339 start_codon:yes stop_codon:yes gene_type:complete